MTDEQLPASSVLEGSPPPYPPPSASAVQPPPVPPGKAAPYRWKGYPGLPLLGIRRSLTGILVMPILAMLLLFGVIALGALWPSRISLGPDAKALALFGMTLAAYGTWLLLPLLGGRKQRVPFRERVALRPFDVAPGVGMAIAVAIVGFYAEVTFAALVVAIGVKPPAMPSLTDVFPTDVLGISIAFVVACLVAPVAEEIIFRGVLFGGLRDRYGEMPAMIVSAVLFSASHFNWFTFVPFVVLGMLLALITSQSRSIGPAIVSHFLFNLNALVLSYGMYFITKTDVLTALPKAISVLLA